VHVQAVARGEDQVIESAKLRKEVFNGPFVGDVNRLPLRFSSDGFNSRVNSFRIA
jgi:hypothetical protein